MSKGQRKVSSIRENTGILPGCTVLFMLIRIRIPEPLLRENEAKLKYPPLT
jgi:hypothetical protein